MTMRKSGRTSPNGLSASRKYDLMADPMFYITFGFFALLTTLLPAALGQPNFLPVVQTLALTLFLAFPLRQGRLDRAILLLSAWLALQFLAMFAGTALLPLVFERAIHDGFDYHRTLLEWSVTGEGLPGWLLSSPLSRLGEVAGIMLGSLFSAGLVGIWFLMRAVNQLGYAVGRLAMDSPQWLLLGLFPWRLATISGYAGFVLLLSQPLLINNWNPVFYVTRQRRLVTVATTMLALGLALELTLPGLWRSAWAP